MKTVYITRSNYEFGIGMTFIGHTQGNVPCAAVSAYALMIAKMLENENLAENIYNYRPGCVVLIIPEKYKAVIDAVSNAVKALAEYNPDIKYREI